VPALRITPTIIRPKLALTEQLDVLGRPLQLDAAGHRRWVQQPQARVNVHEGLAAVPKLPFELHDLSCESRALVLEGG
jgi:hypothetical protein